MQLGNAANLIRRHDFCEKGPFSGDCYAYGLLCFYFCAAIYMLKQLAQLHEQGILTDQEFETKKAEVLAKI